MPVSGYPTYGAPPELGSAEGPQHPRGTRGLRAPDAAGGERPGLQAGGGAPSCFCL